eukprot:10469788-Ditylum_brightwellii.AAC.1
MQTESEGPGVFKDSIRDNGALYALQSNNTKMQPGLSFRKVLRKCNIQSENMEPHHPQQNSAEHLIQIVKRLSTKILDKTGSTMFL